MKISLKLIRFFISATILLVFQLTLGFSQTFDSSQIEWSDLGSQKRIAYIDVSKLKSNTAQSTSESPILLYWDKKSVERKSFYQNEEMYNTSCVGGSILRQNVIHYCIPYADIGYHISTLSGQLNGEFISLNGYGLDVYYEVDKNRFYFFSDGWNYIEGFGPFSGDPKIELPRTVKPRRTEDLKLKIKTDISQR